MRAPFLHVEPLPLSAEALLTLAARDAARYPVLLDSAAEGSLSRVSLLAALPRGRMWLDSRGQLHSEGALPTMREHGFLEALDALWRRESQIAVDAYTNLPFRGGWFVYLGYELAREIEPTLEPWWPPKSREDQRPVAYAMRVPAALALDELGQGLLVCEESVTEAERAQIREDVRRAMEQPVEAGDPPQLVATEEGPEAYLSRVRRAQEYIRSGDIYQSNLSRHWRARVAAGFDAASLYRRLRQSNPAPFAAFAQTDDFSILSSSPERLLRIRGRRVDTRPIAGTHPRGATAAEDNALKEALVAHPKERAEHVMLIDLARNDLGRVCEGGSVRVDEYMAVETYAHVHHIVSNVTGELRADVSPVDALRAVFPGGTITGVPKVRCMQIISELESEPRGPYTGSLGYLNHDGSGDFNILIRTMSLMGRELEFRAGAGIVADSNPERELAESRAKARGLLLALTP
jgi:anthranilate synthase component I